MNEMQVSDWIINGLNDIVEAVVNKKINNTEDNLFNIKYNINAEDFVYILLMASEKFDFKINDEFVDSLNNYSINEIRELIQRYQRI